MIQPQKKGARAQIAAHRTRRTEHETQQNRIQTIYNFVSERLANLLGGKIRKVTEVVRGDCPETRMATVVATGVQRAEYRHGQTDDIHDGYCCRVPVSITSKVS